MNRAEAGGRRAAACVLLAALMACGAWRVQAADQAGVPPVQIEFFYSVGCPDCTRVREDILPQLELVFPGQYVIEFLEVGTPAHARRLVAYQEAFDVWDNEPVVLVVAGRVFLAGYEQALAGLLPAVEAGLAGALPGAPAAADAAEAPRRRLARFTVVGVLVAGLTDSLNPCAIGALVFFISALAVARVRRRRLLLAGACFIAASFVTYFALGFGLLGLLHGLAAFETARRIINGAMVIFLLGLAGLSLRDAWVYRRTGDASRIKGQLPIGLKKKMHHLMRRELRATSLALGSLAIGAGVTLIESVCTGQVYVPTLVLILQGGRDWGRAAALLALYNLMFVLPLILIFWLTYRGLEMPALLAWSRRHVVPGKLLLTAFFLALAALLLWL